MFYYRRSMNYAIGGGAMSVFNVLFGFFLGIPAFYGIALSSLLLSAYGFWRIFTIGRHSDEDDTFTW